MDNERVVLAFAILLLLFNCTVVSCYTWTSEIQLKQGKLKGEINWTNNHKAYLGIPYASVLERFQDAGPAPTWAGTLIANKGSIKCSQYFPLLKRSIGQEDCLVANVFTPITTEKYLLPVMVFIHGGGYYFGSNTDLLYNPKYLVEKDVIVVTINYRLGAFGFLCLHKPEAPGNIGLKDQIVALQWVKNNIQAFGGNPNAITVFGESAGASSIHYMIISGKYKGLFDKAILQSGSALTPNKIDRNPINSASFVASRMGYKTKDPTELLKIFQNARASDIIEASYIDPKNQPSKSYIFRPCVERPIESKSFIITNPRMLAETVKLDPNLNIILGYNDKEGIMTAGKYDFNGLENLNSNSSQLIPENIKFIKESQKATLTHDIRQFYFESGVNYDSLIDFFSDTTIIYPSITSTNLLLSSNVTVYNYYFKYDSFRNLYKFISGLPQKPGANHADELFYIFDPAIFNVLPPKDSDLRLINTLTTLWTNFAKTGKPSSLTTVEWLQSKKDELYFLQLDREMKMISLPNKNRFIFWDQVYKTYT